MKLNEIKLTVVFFLFLFVGLHQSQPVNAILNCLLAHQLCSEDAACSSMLTVIRHICGPETGKLNISLINH